MRRPAQRSVAMAHGPGWAVSPGTTPRVRASEPPRKPVPRFLLHLDVEFVGRVVQTAAELLGDARLGVARGELGEAPADAVEVEESVLRAVDHEEGGGDRQGGDVGVIEV